MKIKEIRDRALACIGEAKAIQDKAAGRAMNADEVAQIKAKLDEADRLNAEAAALEEADATAARLSAALSAPQGRRTAPEPVAAATPPAPGVPVARIEPGQDRAALRPWESWGHMAQAVAREKLGSPRDVRLNAAIVPAFESDGVDGGYLVPPEISKTIVQKVFAEDSLAAKCDSITLTQSNAIELPVDTTTPWGTKGVQVYWDGEGDTIKSSKGELDLFEAKTQRVTAMVAMTGELLQDAPALSGYLASKVPVKIDYKLTEGILNGTGTKQPLGMLKSAFKIATPKEGAQVADTIVKANIDKMWSSMYAPFRSGAFWLINQDCEPQLEALAITGTNSGVFPVYLPPNGVAGAPYATLKGRPVYITEACAALGDEGDIVLINPSTYCLVKRGGMQSDVSIHFLFDTNATAFRFILRVGGQPWFNAPIDRAKGVTKLSGVVSLAARA
jgi:HK97 family phage major capsid protein